MKLRELLRDVDYELVQGNLDIEVSDVAYDSRVAHDGVMFMALVGFRVDGHDYIESAIANGCRVIAVSKEVSVSDDITVVRLKDTRVDLSRISRTLFGYPDKEMTTIAITGTKGKTTSSTMIWHILNESGVACGLIGTMGVFYLYKYYHTMNTSPEAYDVFKYMRQMLDNGVRHLVMEVSSQSLKLKRWVNVIFDYAIFTNLSLDHVGEDEHESFEDYRYCKSLLFKQCKVGIFNTDSEDASYMMEGVNCKKYYYGMKDSVDYRLVECHNVIENGFTGVSLQTDGKIQDTFMVSILGTFTAYNALAAISVCDLLGIDVSKMKEALRVVSVKGRMESVPVSKYFSVIIDYAYQGIAMENVLKTVRESNPGRIVTVFGCGGNRSRQRRYDCGYISGKYSDFSILTADNPRYENNDDIIKDILVGMNKTDGKYKIIGDRKEAIRYSILNAKKGDVILVLGKGHEDYQEIEGVRHSFDERVIIREIIADINPQDRERLGIIDNN